MDYTVMGQRIRRYRVRKRLTQEQLAEFAGISASFMGHIERGSRVASLDTVMKICSALGVTPNDLLEEDASVSTVKWPDMISISPQRLPGDMAEWLSRQEKP